MSKKQKTEKTPEKQAPENPLIAYFRSLPTRDKLLLESVSWLRCLDKMDTLINEAAALPDDFEPKTQEECFLYSYMQVAMLAS